MFNWNSLVEHFNAVMKSLASVWAPLQWNDLQQVKPAWYMVKPNPNLCFHLNSYRCHKDNLWVNLTSYLLLYLWIQLLFMFMYNYYDIIIWFHGILITWYTCLDLTVFWREYHVWTNLPLWRTSKLGDSMESMDCTCVKDGH